MVIEARSMVDAQGQPLKYVAGATLQYHFCHRHGGLQTPDGNSPDAAAHNGVTGVDAQDPHGFSPPFFQKQMSTIRRSHFNALLEYYSTIVLI